MNVALVLCSMVGGAPSAWPCWCAAAGCRPTGTCWLTLHRTGVSAHREQPPGLRPMAHTNSQPLQARCRSGPAVQALLALLAHDWLLSHSAGAALRRADPPGASPAAACNRLSSPSVARLTPELWAAGRPCSLLVSCMVPCNSALASERQPSCHAADGTGLQGHRSSTSSAAGL